MFPRLCLLSLTFVISLLIFQSGFLLKRHELHFTSTCGFKINNGTQCWMPQQYTKIVILLVDALRYDFLLPLGSAESSSSNFRGHMPGVEKLLQQGAAVGTVLADPPTTTLQRIKGLTTGTLPTFIDSADNFSPDAVVNEDNFISQLFKLNRTIRFYGDDTWFSLYPELNGAGSAGYPSFDVTDLDTVDEAVRIHLEEHFKGPNRVADLVVGHTLGVDHCGHKFGPTHPVMATILSRTDQLITATAWSLQPGEMLIVLGDHGMTATGDHGGDSDDETHAGIFVYSPGRSFSLPADPLSQIDLVPTVSLLLGVPIPFSNLGIVIRDLFPEQLQNLAIKLNYDQIINFARTYARTYSFPELVAATLKDEDQPEDQLENMDKIQKILREAWTRFDWPRMRSGLVSMLEIILFIYSGREMDIPEAIVRSGCLLLQFSIWLNGSEDAFNLLTGVLFLSIFYSLGYLFFIFAVFSRNLLRSPLHLLSIVAVLLHAVTATSNSFVVYEGHVLRHLLQGLTTIATWIQLKQYLTEKRPEMRGQTIISKAAGFWTTKQGILAAVALVVLRAEPLFHRCREEEIDCETSIFVQMLGAVSFLAILFAVPIGEIAAIIIVCVRNNPKVGISLKTNICLEKIKGLCLKVPEREERSLEMDYIFTRPFLRIFFAADARFWRLMVSWIALFLYYYLLRRVIYPTQSTGLQLIWPLSRLVFLLIACHQLIQLAIVSSFVTIQHLPAAAMYLAQAVYLSSLIALIIVMMSRKSATSVEIQQHAAYAISWSLLLILGDGLTLSFLGFILLTVALVILCDNDSLPWICSLLLAFGFYFTGHSPTIPAIPWNAGFIGIPGNFILKAAPGLLISSHLFSATIVLILLLPMLTSHQSTTTMTLLPRMASVTFLRAFFVSYAALHHRRHLMVWKIFAPHFIFESVSFLVLITLVVMRQMTL